MIVIITHVCCLFLFLNLACTVKWEMFASAKFLKLTLNGIFEFLD